MADYASFKEELTALGSQRVYDHPRGVITMDKGNSTYYIGEMPAEGYDSVISSFSAYGDAAIVAIGRVGGEGGDLTQAAHSPAVRPDGFTAPASTSPTA